MYVIRHHASPWTVEHLRPHWTNNLFPPKGNSLALNGYEINDGHVQYQQYWGAVCGYIEEYLCRKYNSQLGNIFSWLYIKKLWLRWIANALPKNQIKKCKTFLTYVMCIANAFYQCQSWRGPALQEEGGGSRAGWVRVTWINWSFWFWNVQW